MSLAGVMAVMVIATVVVMRRLVFVRLLLGIRRHTVGRLGVVEGWAEGPGITQASMEVKLSVHVMVVVW
jgi:hypothetical protein